MHDLHQDAEIVFTTLRPRPQPARLLSVGTALPPHLLLQSEVVEAARLAFGPRFSDFERIARVFKTSGIRKRHAVRPIDWYGAELGWPERNNAFLEAATELFQQAAEDALAKAGLQAGDVDTVVTVSSTGIATPSLEAMALERMGFRSDIARAPIFGLGCAGGVTGLALAARLAQSQPGSVVLMVAVELCTLAFRLDELTKANIVATALFGDGAAACVLQAGGSAGPVVEASGEHIWPGTLSIMGWEVDAQGFGVVFDKAIPPFARENLAPALGGIVERMGRSMSDVGRFICHPGGQKVIAALEESLELQAGTLDHEREVLAECGNMSAPTVLFVLDRVMREGLPPRALVSALGPGFTASAVMLRRGA